MPFPGRTRLAVAGVGAAGVVASVFGFAYDKSYLDVDWVHQVHPPLFFKTYGIMVSVDIAILAAEAVLGAALILLGTRWARLFIGSQLVVVGRFFSLGSLWLIPRYGMSIAAATGISSGSMVPLFVALPLWGSLICWWAVRRDERCSDVAEPRVVASGG